MRETGKVSDDLLRESKEEEAKRNTGKRVSW
jgi:hypothetical protein